MIFEVNALKISIQFVYGPSDKDRPAFLDNIVFPQDNNTKLILVGDWNIVQHEINDRSPNVKKYYKPLSHTALNNMMFEHDLVDPWRQHNIGQEYFSYRRWDQTAKSRIDFALLNNAAYSLLDSASYTPNPIVNTDHDIFHINL
jgi:exonuclease III